MARTSIPVTKIAQDLGISPATVSRVLNHPELVLPETRLRIESALKNAGYDPEAIMQEKNLSSKKVIMVVLPTIENPFYNNILKGIRTSVNSHGFDVVIYTGNITETSLSRFLSVARMASTGGIICLGRKMEAEVADTIDDEIPLVQCCEYNNKAKSVYVSINDFLAAKNAVEHMLNLGYRRIAFINGPIAYNYAQERLRGFEAALEGRDVTVPQNWKISLPEVSYSLGFSAASQLLGTEDKPEAIFCAADVFALSVIKAAHRYRLNVPNDLGVVGFDNIEVASIAVPGLTTVNQPAYQIGFTAGETMYERIRDPESRPRSILLDTELISRDSIIPLRRKE
ncbi:MAG: LacI family DNA-binding transcriptional regulator [Bullifex sp.]